MLSSGEAVGRRESWQEHEFTTEAGEARWVPDPRTRTLKVQCALLRVLGVSWHVITKGALNRVPKEVHGRSDDILMCDAVTLPILVDGHRDGLIGTVHQ